MSENFEFWKMVLYSPAIIALAGGIAASFFHLITMLINIRHESQTKLMEWNRSEKSRKNTLMFEKKCQVYEEYADCFDPKNANFIILHEKIRFILVKLVLYGSDDVKNAAREHFYALVDAHNNPTNTVQNKQQIENTGNILHQRMMEDIQTYTSCNLSN